MKKNKIVFVTGIFIVLNVFLICQKGFAQQDAMFTQYMFNTLAMNPAYAGDNEVVTATALFRKQWINIEGAPTTGTFSIDAPLRQDRMGLGLNIISDRIGITNTFGAYASYAYRIKTSEEGRLCFGLQAGFSQYTARLADVAYTQNQSAYNDPAFSNNINAMMPNVGGGVWYNNNKFYVGLSAPHLINNALQDKYTFLTDLDGARQFRHYFLTSGYVFDINQDIKLKPSFLFKVVEGAPFSFDLNANVWFYDKFGVGLSYRSNNIISALRTGDSADILLEYQASNQLRFGYAFDYTLTDLRKYNSGSHEIMARYQFSTNKSKILTPRYF
jgi:type IX secretion system PorP/SprF family membrane protein